MPPAWAMGPVSRSELRHLPFRYFETLRGVFDGQTNLAVVLALREAGVEWPDVEVKAAGELPLDPETMREVIGTTLSGIAARHSLPEPSTEAVQAFADLFRDVMPHLSFDPEVDTVLPEDLKDRIRAAWTAIGWQRPDDGSKPD